MLTNNSKCILIAVALTAPAMAQQNAVSITENGETCQIKLLTGPGHETWAAVDCTSGLDTRFYYYGVKCRGRGPSTLYVSNASTPGPIETRAWQRDGDNVYGTIARKICDMREEKR